MAESEAGRAGGRRLSLATIGSVPAAIRRPAYDPARLAIGMAHLGVGAFHRCHQAEFTDDAIELSPGFSPGAWGVVGINLRPPFIGADLAAQDGLYARVLREGSDAQTRVIGCLRQVIEPAGPGAIGPAIEALSAPEIAVVTMTVTEKGYCHVPATGRLDRDHPLIRQDLADGGARTVPGLLAAVLERRRATGAGGVTLVSCDNISANGRILKSVVLDIAASRSVDLARWIEAQMRFPSTMVDRIVPATSPADLALVAEELGLSDGCTVVGEPFRQWVIEDDFAASRPPWELAGAQFVRSAEPYEHVKMRLLNGAQSAFSYFGALAGLETTGDATRDPVIGAFVRRMLEDESASTVPSLPGIEARAYIELSLARVRNPAIRHRNHQVATDGSQKIVQRLLDPIRDRLRAGAPFDHLATAVAGWMAYLACASPRLGARWEPSDPFAAPVRAIADRLGGDGPALAAEIMGIGAVFGRDLADSPAKALIGERLGALLGPDPRPVLSALMAGATAG